ncbi:hypothetical protein LEP1GSC047_2106 [Leptospira inadai serovar Lyme str. 10]|uniref:Yip1 domain protein n=2 Tax=Leptospira inadai serovar Lyme TaxID=293084 RepID=V6HEH5_9LEPT|nr:hypothetical protein [Leptospira inadai]EQA38462.1 hypothetical protein LEP1GSC047_2106 [Leptospira inadai serovar Lyme str. 10]PNV72617.1 hypothetical protein BES34_018820 [Leptospira inadai serovar Lyme]
MRIEIGVAIQEKLANQITEVGAILREKISLESWSPDLLRSGILRYVVTFAVTGLLNAANILIGVYLRDFNPNSMIENLYAQKEIGSLVYFFSHFPQNILGWFLLWGLLPFFLAGCWYLFFVILNGKEKNAQAPTVSLLSVNALLLPLLAIAAQEVFSFAKLVFRPGGIAYMIFAILWVILTFGAYLGSLLYSIQGFRKQFDQPTGRAAAIVLSPAIILLLATLLFK